MRTSGKLFLIAILFLSPAVTLTGCGGSSSGEPAVSAPTYTVGGSVSGLPTGTSVALQNNAGDDLTVSADGSFTFSTALSDGAAYLVTVMTQPNGATCTASANSGTIAGANVTTVDVTCSSTTYTVGGSVSGLPTGESVGLQNNARGEMTVTGNGSFSFAVAVADGSGYLVTVKTQPANAACVVTNGSGTVSSANVTDVTVDCTSVTISGTVVDGNTDAPLADIVVSARNPSDDSVFNSATTDASGFYSLAAPMNHDFYLHAQGNTVGSTTYVSDNYQIENESVDRTLDFWLIDTATVNTMATALGFDPVKDAVFSMGIKDTGGTGVAGVTVTPTPGVSTIWYQQTDGSFLATTGPTTTGTDPSVIGNVADPGANGTYTFTLSPDKLTAGYTIDDTFKLRLIPGEISEAIEP
ncbi:carboxypeptidase-like regulatory domain-containing protein [Geothermobacter hydrogeniphilus]|uniref:Carboxypeptidase regulatory-like domain-containing protein n=1 Tax=Geothermobacter hydrogeniphilus TaxID=1969733 RepID=A0A1X0Y5P3_9BACT|nr:carboxypeptidase-like regulatory domain-containing protein [Geothermobacter hydrogeniphilus]ORJ60466.1 hypothetical protein B5V00_07840 [Geothermobacter hydrogeniphilus]